MSPVLPSLSAPSLPERVLGLLRTPPTNHQSEDSQYITASWGSPYPQSDTAHIRPSSLSSEPSEDSPVHHLEIHTPFLRPAPLFGISQAESHASSSLVSAAVLANRARRPARGLTEDWIRQHTTSALTSESRHWLSDGTVDSEPSSLSGSVSGDEASWLEDPHLRTPRANPTKPGERRRASRRSHRKRSSNETLRQASINSLNSRPNLQVPKMASVDSDKTLPDHASGRSLHTPSSSVHETTPTLETPNPTVSMNGSIASPKAEKPLPSTPSRVSAKHERTNPQAVSPRFKKKIAWNGKNIMVSLPRDERRGQLGQSPMPLNETEVSRMVRSWEELGYDTKGFDLNWMDTISADDDHSKSRDAWPSAEELNDEKAARNYRVVLPDLNGESR